MKLNRLVKHFHSSDYRFCGSTYVMREFTFNASHVTCKGCLARDTKVLTFLGEYVKKKGDYREVLQDEASQHSV